MHNSVNLTPNHSDFQTFWGGPDRPPRSLRNLLEERIHSVPSGGEIFWVTYYFRDEGLAAALLRAHRRGVKVRVVVEGNPRTAAVNLRVIDLLQGRDRLGQGLRALNHRLRDLRSLKNCRLHEKLYYFSHPVPNVFVGTFNPSGNIPDDPEIISHIGDQDRGHNLLVQILDPCLVNGLYWHAQHVFNARHGPWEIFFPCNYREISSGTTKILFFPRLRCREFNKMFAGLHAGSRLRIAVSHLNDPGTCNRLLQLAQRGVRIEILAHDTERRVPEWVETQMQHNGIVFNRYVHSDKLPMHNKFMLFETSSSQSLAFGSLNLSVRSLRANHELLVITKEPSLYAAMEKRWQEMLNEVKASE